MFKKKRAEVQENRLKLITDSAPFEYVEAYKTLRTNVSFVSVAGKNRKILVTSTVRDEGKTCISINLSISLAQAGNKVLLIDTDMRNPSVRRYLQLKSESNLGLSELLTGKAKVGDCLIHTEYGVDIITGGQIPPNPVELISSEAMKELLKVAAQRYDYVICDAPPVGVITDAAALSPLCDGVLFVIRQKFANRNHIRSAIQSLQRVDAKILGVIMGQYTIPKSSGKYYGPRRKYRYGYSYGYGYGYGYGYSPENEQNSSDSEQKNEEE